MGNHPVLIGWTAVGCEDAGAAPLAPVAALGASMIASVSVRQAATVIGFDMVPPWCEISEPRFYPYPARKVNPTDR